MKQAVLIVDLENRIEMANPEALELLGYAGEALAGRAIDSVVGKDRAKTTGGEGQEARWIARNGRLVPVRMTVSDLFDAGGKLQARVYTGMSGNELGHTDLVTHAPDAITILDVDQHRWIEVNENTARLYGYPREKLLQMGPWDVSPEYQPDGRPSRDAAREKLEDALAGGTPVFEWVHRNAEGELFPCEVRLARIPHATRRLVRGSIVDIRERKKLEEKLVEERALLRALIDSIPDYVFVKDTGGVYLLCNKTTEEFFNASEAEIVGRTDFDFVDRETAEAFRAQDQKVLAAGCSLRNEEWLHYADGRRVRVETVKTPFYGPEGRLLGLVGVARDITERRRAEAALRES
ncbi:MAG: PAS domain S-box protein, partial [Methylothermaceae bacterium]|nr:PAS domain S-box protein [Methylothermaceae bacterium]